jgi:hypothetical protein
VDGPAFLVEHQVTGAEQARPARPADVGPVAGGASAVDPMVAGSACGNAPERPRRARALRGYGRGRRSGSAHQCLGGAVAFGVSAKPLLVCGSLLVPLEVVLLPLPLPLFPLLPPTMLALSGSNRTS